MNEIENNNTNVEEIEEADNTAVEETANELPPMPETSAPEKYKGIKMSYEKRKAMYGYCFIALWFVGSIYFFVAPLIQSLIYSFHQTKIVQGGMEMTNPGFKNYYNAFRKDQYYVPALTAMIKNTLLNTPLIIVFSVFIAVILNQKFKGRTAARAIFFLPVIIATGPVIDIINGNMSTGGYSGGSEQFSTMFETNLVDDLLNFLGIYNISDKLTDVISTLTSDIMNLVWKCGIQILLFLSALQGIPYSAKEAASMEGATAWEYFWKITVPYISPMLIAALVYTIVDSFVDPGNEVMTLVLNQSKQWEHGYSAALAWAYFLIVGVILGIALLILNRFVYYEVE
ncbi:ABC-type sugar transport system, permease component [Ruminococcus sp. YE71]|uniref:carbohydrate ABC transporter permease n=1 Tax=unclassified Ruminococcus TaxID=2608920 RepID=UPI0008817BE2|nr:MULTISPECIES: sugar ABC transporter permease [unclassified Ruminococcus]SDA14685.1 ABC-type sugar transport system, permease component [Ruminococcus sp. YE78]SFW21337.1 ABC-type sugar transport system, permease component [Ruminococcus sp. YE71]